MELRDTKLTSIAERHAAYDREFAHLLSELTQAPNILPSPQSSVVKKTDEARSAISGPAGALYENQTTSAMSHAAPTTAQAPAPVVVSSSRNGGTPARSCAPPCMHGSSTARGADPAPARAAVDEKKETGKTNVPRYHFSRWQPYPVQRTMMNAIRAVLEGLSPVPDRRGTASWTHRPVALVACEVPTGCGKTASLLSSVLQFLESVRQQTTTEAEAFFARNRYWTPKRRQQHSTSSFSERLCGPPAQPLTEESLASLPASCARHTGYAAVSSSADATEVSVTASSSSPSRHARRPPKTEPERSEEDVWTAPSSFFKAFRVVANKRLRAELDPTGSSALRQQFIPPPCTIFYAARTHAQLKQAVNEMTKLEGASRHVRMNILGSRDHYCVNPTVVHAKGNHTLPVEGNNLGEVCDKLVSLGQCPCVETYGELACKAISDDMVGGRAGRLWDVEDLVAEGSAQQACPYYAARDLVFFADINFCAYNYLLDPIIRHECKMEGSIQNHAIVVLDEAHNVPGVCQEALSLEISLSVLALIERELAPLTVTSQTTDAKGTTTPSEAEGTFLSYPRDFKLTYYTLVELFALLLAVFRGIDVFFRDLAASSVDATGQCHSQDSRSATFASSSTAKVGADTPSFVTGEALAAKLHMCMRQAAAQCVALSEARTSSVPAAARRREAEGVRHLSPEQHATAMYKQIYGIVMILGVTFNPFNFSIFALSHIKRWLVVLRFLFERPSAFALSAHVASPTAGAATSTVSISPAETADGLSGRTTCAVRCLDGSLAFHHLLRSTYRVILASGTLSPFDQLAKDLGLTPDMWHIVEGQHVVGANQFQLHALTRLPHAHEAPSPLQCTYVSLSNTNFVARLASAVMDLALTVPLGGVLVFAPNYHTMQALFAQAQKRLAAMSSASSRAQIPGLFCEPRKALELVPILDTFKHASQRRTTVLFAVYRGKVSEGIDFTDSMARLVVCVGVPLQPLKSWRVAAQRAHSGPDWYTTDAVRAVNQALGRCLRHAKDFGTVVLLECRYEQSDYQRRLSRWCREALRVDDNLSDLCASLSAFYKHWVPSTQPPPPRLAQAGAESADQHHECGRENAFGAPARSPHESASSRGFGHVLAQLPGNTRSHRLKNEVNALPHSQLVRGASSHDSDRHPGTPSLSDVKQHLWSSTAIKLLYEECADTKDVSGAQLRGRFEDLKAQFDGDGEE